MYYEIINMNYINNINNQMDGILEALNPKKEVFGLSGKEEELANKEAEQEELPQYSDDETGMDFTGADGDPDR